MVLKALHIAWQASVRGKKYLMWKFYPPVLDMAVKISAHYVMAYIKCSIKQKNTFLHLFALQNYSESEWFARDANKV